MQDAIVSEPLLKRNNGDKDKFNCDPPFFWLNIFSMFAKFGW